MTILAFLQNQWFRDPERVRTMVARNGEEYRRRLMVYALAQSHSGRRLRAQFGDLFLTIRWEEVSPQIGSHSASVFPADHDHIRRLLAEVRPDVVLGFGALAREALPLLHAGPMLFAPHPAARGAGTATALAECADRLRKLLSTAPARQRPRSR